MYSSEAGDWARPLLDRLKIPTGILPRIVKPGTILGQVRPDICRAAGFASTFPVIAGATHDTGSAVAGIPNLDSESVFLSSGTWSLMGVEVDKPVTSNEAFALNYTNEGGVAGTIRLLKNVTGLWLLQECHRQWSREGHHLDWSEVMRLAEAAEPLQTLIDTDDPAFRAPLNMVEAIHEYCRATSQPIPGSVGQLARACLESLCVKYRIVLEQLRSITGRRLDTIRVVGGGSQNRLLCQWTADACECKVIAGPVEASALGNVMMQAVATGQIANVKAGREAIGRSVTCESYIPGDFLPWIRRDYSISGARSTSSGLEFKSLKIIVYFRSFQEISTMSSYAVPVLESPQSLAADEIYLISSGDLRQSANQVCWAAQAEVERQVTEAFAAEGIKIRRANPFNAELGHGFVYNQRMGMDVFMTFDPDAPHHRSGSGLAVQPQRSLRAGEPSRPHSDHRKLVGPMAGAGRDAQPECLAEQEPE